jgi:hypothetical protein
LLTVVTAVMLQVGARHLSIKGLPIELSANRRPVAIVTLKHRTLSPVTQLFIDHARAVATAMANEIVVVFRSKPTCVQRENRFGTSNVGSGSHCRHSPRR